MDFIFNEFSFRDTFSDLHAGRTGMEGLLKVCKRGSELGMSKLATRLDFYEQLLTTGYRVIDWLSDQAVSKTLKDLLLSIVKHPYIDNNDTSVEDRYILSNTFLLDDNTSKAEGFTIAYLYDTMSASLYTSEKWNVNEVNLRFSKEGTDDEIVKIKHASQIVHVDGHKDWIVSRIGMRLSTTDLRTGQKQIHLRDDHGKDVLSAFSRKLVRSPYIFGVINSLPFNPHDHNFIKNCYGDGRIEIVLVRSDEGFGIIVQTSGNNLPETEAISQILLEEFQDEY
jgi:hypothetical protein